MKEIDFESFDNLRDLYLNNDYNSMKVLYSKLTRVKRKLIYYCPIIIYGKDNEKLEYLNSEETFEHWASENFPLISKELKKGNKSILNDDDDFPDFKEILITPDKVSSRPKMKRIKKLRIYDIELPLKQNFQEIEDIIFKEDELILAIEMSNKASIKICKPKDIFDSKYQLRIEDAEKIECSIKGDFWEFININGQIRVFKNDILDSQFNGKSIFLNSFEIIK